MTSLPAGAIKACKCRSIHVAALSASPAQLAHGLDAPSPSSSGTAPLRVNTVRFGDRLDLSTARKSARTRLRR
jgi:hypothetical protein